MLTSLGQIEIAVPRSREQGSPADVIGRYRRRTEEVDDMIAEAYVSGVSQRKMGANRPRATHAASALEPLPVPPDVVVGDYIDHPQLSRLDAVHQAITVVDACFPVVLFRLNGLDPHAWCHLLLHEREDHLVRSLLPVMRQGRVALLESTRELGSKELLLPRHPRNQSLFKVLRNDCASWEVSEPVERPSRKSASASETLRSISG